jgi:fructose-1,6-bisphosphatase II
VDIAVDPLEGTNLCATASPGAISVLAVAARGHLLNAPDTYMHKIASGPAGRGVISLSSTPARNVQSLAEAKRCKPEDLAVVVLERPRHEALVAELRATGARIVLISDGDVAPVLLACTPGSGVDLVYGTGGAPEGVLAAAAVACLGGELCAQLAFRNEDERRRARAMGIEDLDRHLGLGDLVRGDVVFVATGVTTGPLLRGIRREGDRVRASSLALDSRTRTLRRIDSELSLPAA